MKTKDIAVAPIVAPIDDQIEQTFRDWKEASAEDRADLEAWIEENFTVRQGREFNRLVADWRGREQKVNESAAEVPFPPPGAEDRADAEVAQSPVGLPEREGEDMSAGPPPLSRGAEVEPSRSLIRRRTLLVEPEYLPPKQIKPPELEAKPAVPEPMPPAASVLAPAVADDPDAAGEINYRDERSLQNAKVAIAKLGIRCQFDDFHKKFVVHGHLCMKGGAVSESLDSMALMVRNEISKTFKMDVPKALVMEALQIKSFERAFDPVRDYLDGLRWDKRKRLDRWLVDYCGAEDTEYTRAVGRKVLIAAVRRARLPGCKFDYLMVMEGPQGAGKSTALCILAGTENFSDARVLKLRDKEQQEAIAGIWIYEIAELAGKHIDVEEVKAFLSKTVDAARGAYGHARTDQRRRCIFVATTNNDQYLKDETGNRRFWPVRVGQIDLECLRLDRDQLWAEAVEAEASGEALVIPEALWRVAAEAAAERMEYDPWEGTLGAKLAQLEAAASAGKALGTKLFALGEDDDGPHWRVASEYLLTDVLKIPSLKQTNYQNKRLAKVMKSLGWVSCKNALRFGGSGQKRGFVKLIVEEPVDRGVMGVTGCDR